MGTVSFWGVLHRPQLFLSHPVLLDAIETSGQGACQHKKCLLRVGSLSWFHCLEVLAALPAFAILRPATRAIDLRLPSAFLAGRGIDCDDLPRAEDGRLVAGEWRWSCLLALVLESEDGSAVKADGRV